MIMRGAMQKGFTSTSQFRLHGSFTEGVQDVRFIQKQCTLQLK